MIPLDREWFKCEGASSEALAALRKDYGDVLPAEYFELLAFSNGGEGALGVMPYNLCLDSAEYALEYAQCDAAMQFFSGFFVFGGNGGGELLAFDMRATKPWPIVVIDAANSDLNESVHVVAGDLRSLLACLAVRES